MEKILKEAFEDLASMGIPADKAFYFYCGAMVVMDSLAAAAQIDERLKACNQEPMAEAGVKRGIAEELTEFKESLPDDFPKLSAN